MNELSRNHWYSSESLIEREALFRNDTPPSLLASVVGGANARNRWQVKPEKVAGCHQLVFELSPAGVAYYLPTFLEATLLSLDMEDDFSVCYELVFALSQPEYAATFQMLSATELASVVMTLEFIETRWQEIAEDLHFKDCLRLAKRERRSREER